MPTIIELYQIIKWMVTNGRLPNDLSKNDYADLLNFTVAMDNDDMDGTQQFERLLAEKLLNIVDINNISYGIDTVCMETTFDGIKYNKVIEGWNLTTSKLIFQTSVLLDTINQPQYQ